MNQNYKKLTRLFSSLYSPSRNSKFSKISQQDLDYFSSFLPSSSIKTNDLDQYNHDVYKVFQGSSTLVLQPSTTSEISKILKYCNMKSLAVTPQGGNTGLVGGSVPVHDEIVLHTGKMNRIIGIDKDLGIIKTECGVVLETLQNECEKEGFIFPIDLGAKGSCFVGGNLSTCAAGIRLLRYGSLHANLLGLEVVTAEGNVLNTLDSPKRQENFMNLSQLFVGSEGTLGIITKASVLLSPKSSSQTLIFLGCNSFQDTLSILKLSKIHLAEIISAFEMQDRESLQIVLDNIPNTVDPFEKPHPFYVLLECSGVDSVHNTLKLEVFLQEILGKYANDGVMPQDLKQFSQI